LNISEKQILKRFVKKFWFTPSDVFLRSKEAFIWKKQKFESPIMSVGCGDGTIDSLIFYGKGKLDLGIDIDPKNVKEAKMNGLYKEVIVADASKLDGINKRFRTVVSNSTLEHIRDDKSVIKNIFRVLEKDGYFLFTVPSPLFKKGLNRLGKENSSRINNRLKHYNYRSKNEWKALLKRNGFVEIKIHEYMNDTEWTFWLKMLRLTIYKIGNSELWSLIKKMEYIKVLRKPLSLMIYILLKNKLEDTYTSKGYFYFIKARI
jgi:SAM-dependent methyltransferase